MGDAMSFREIILTQGKVALVDTIDYDFLSKWKWCLHGKYAVRNARLSNGNMKTLQMHRLILLPREDEYADHINQDTLDNRRVNLRPCSTAENQRNRDKPKNNTSGYKGVYWHQTNQKWAAKIVVDYKKIHLGSYEDKRDAALAYNDAALRYYGEFAYLNTIKGG